MMRDIWLEQAQANRFINRTWLEALGHLSLEELERPQGAFFRSIFGTWNHILLADRIWLGRVQGEPYPVNSLADRPCADMDSLRHEREATDARLIQLVEDTADFGQIITYRNSKGTEFRDSLRRILAHLFAHQHHHRGQIAQMCHEREIAIPDGGLIGYYRAEAGT